MAHDDRGVYVLVIDLNKKLDIKVGKLGMTAFISQDKLWF